MRGVPLLLWTTCNSVSVGLLSESVGHADMLVTYTIHRKLLLRRTFVICFHSRISICSVHYRNIILNTRQIYTKTFLITSSVAWIWNHSNLNVFIIATKCWTQNRNTHQWHITVSSNNIIDDLQCISLFSPQSFSLNTVSSQTLTMRTTHAVYCTGQVSGFIIFGSDLHNARGIKLNLHNSFDYTCY